MKKMLLAAALMLGVLSCTNRAKVAVTTEEEETIDPMENEVLVAYFSATGTTRRIAELMIGNFDADLAEIVPAVPYTEADLDWHDKKSRSSLEMKNPKARPELAQTGTDVSKYRLVYLGYPIWWGEAPRIINSFIESQQWDSVRVIPFATSGGSPVEPSVEALRKTYPEMLIEDGLLLNNVQDDGLCGDIEE